MNRIFTGLYDFIILLLIMHIVYHLDHRPDDFPAYVVMALLCIIKNINWKS